MKKVFGLALGAFLLIVAIEYYKAISSRNCICGALKGAIVVDKYIAEDVCFFAVQKPDGTIKTQSVWSNHFGLYQIGDTLCTK